MSKTILVPVDGSEASLKAIDVAAEYLVKGDDRLVLLNVVHHHHAPKELSRFFETEFSEAPPENEYDRMLASGVLEEARRRVYESGIENVEVMIEVGVPAKKIVTAAEKTGADMIVMGSRGLGSVGGMAFGSVSQKVSHTTDCTVLIVK